MRRRTVLRCLAAGGSVLLVGCLGIGSQPEVDEADTSRIRSVSVDPTPTCHDAVGTSFLEDSVVLTGCFEGSEGCGEFVVAERILIEGSFAVTIAIDGNVDDNEGCTGDEHGAGYELLAEFDGDIPHTVSVVHRRDGMDMPVGSFTDPERAPSGE